MMRWKSEIQAIAERDVQDYVGPCITTLAYCALPSLLAPSSIL